MIDVKVEVRGIAELAAAYRRVNSDLAGELKQSLLDIATRVAGVATSRMPYKSGAAVGSVKPRATARGAAIAWGGQAAPYLPWLDFGGSVGRGHRPGAAWSGSIRRPWQGVPVGMGRYIYPAISEARPDTERAIDQAIKHVAESAGFDTKGSLL